jgi:hypothetical protein
MISLEIKVHPLKRLSENTILMVFLQGKTIFNRPKKLSLKKKLLKNIFTVFKMQYLD